MFVSRETQEKIDKLEADNLALRQRLGDLEEAQSITNPWKPVGVTFIVLFLLSAAFGVYSYFFTQPADPFEHIPIVTKTGLDDWHAIPDSGIAYHVQIGAFKEFDLSPYQADLESVYLFKNDSLQRITLGKFVRFNQAQEFQEKVVDLGLDFAYITAYKDGETIGLMKAIKSESTTESGSKEME